MKERITICSSMKFSDQIKVAAKILEEQGYKVFTPELSEKAESYSALSVEEQKMAKRSFIKNHFKRIESSDAILVLNYEKNGITGYIGSNTLMEIGVAYALGKTIYILNIIGDQACKEEVLALASIILNGNLQNLRQSTTSSPVNE